MNLIKLAKILLYELLLNKKTKDLTNDEVDLMYLLSKDKNIQKHLQKNIDKHE